MFVHTTSTPAATVKVGGLKANPSMATAEAVDLAPEGRSVFEPVGCAPTTPTSPITSTGTHNSGSAPRRQVRPGVSIFSCSTRRRSSDVIPRPERSRTRSIDVADHRSAHAWDDRHDLLRLGAALLIAVSAGIHVRLYLGGYRDIHLVEVAGIDLASSFALAICMATALSILLVAVVVCRRAETPTTIVAAAYCVGVLVAYAITRTIGLLGFEESTWTPEAAVSKPVELLALALLVSPFVSTWPWRWSSAHLRPRRDHE